MQQTQIKAFGDGQKFSGFLLVKSAEQRIDQRGKYYLDMNLVDSSGEVNCKMWGGFTQVPEAGSVVHIVRSQIQIYNGRIQMKIEEMKPAVPEDQVDMSQLVASAPATAEEMMAYMDSVIDSFSSDHLKKLVREMIRLTGEELKYYPGGMWVHHAEKGGLLHHTTDMLHTAEAVLKCYPFLNADLLRAGVIVHDLAKTSEMLSDSMGKVTDYSRDGQLIGHLVRGVANLQTAARNCGIGGEWVVLLEHMILSHHGVAEHGSPQVPKILEAEVLHILDYLDSRVYQMRAAVEKTPVGAFSEKIAILDGRRMYHPYYSDEAE